MSKHVFVVMPFGQKEGKDFDAIYKDLLKPALELADLIPLRADEESSPGDIRLDMFQELVLADLVVADLSINNANVWYELGIRHGVKTHGILQIRHGTEKMPFDVCTDRTFHYELDEATGKPDPDTLEQQRENLAKLAIEAIAPTTKPPTSPLYQYFPGLKEPAWKEVRNDGNSYLWAEFDNWNQLLTAAQKDGHAADILILAEEAPTRSFEIEALLAASCALRDLQQPDFALEQIEKVLEFQPQHEVARQHEAVLRGRLGDSGKATAIVQRLVTENSGDAESLALQGRIFKEAWLKRWQADASPEQAKQQAINASAFLTEAANSYRQAFLLQPGHYYSGINALSLDTVTAHLQLPIQDVALQETMGAGLRWVLTAELKQDQALKPNYWGRASLAELETLIGEPATAMQCWRNAAACGEWFGLDSSRQQLLFLQQLGFRNGLVTDALKIVDERLAEFQPPWEPARVLLFSGHMIDQPDRPEPRFPEAKAEAAAAAIASRLEKLEAGPDDLAVCSAACGGDLLFAEACMARGVRLSVHLADAEPDFIKNSISFAGEHWVERFYDLQDNSLSTIQILQQRLGNGQKHSNKYERTNLWMLYTALSQRTDKTFFISLWNGEQSGNRGGTGHMQEVVRKRSGRIYSIDPSNL